MITLKQARAQGVVVTRHMKVNARACLEEHVCVQVPHVGGNNAPPRGHHSYEICLKTLSLL